MRVSRLTGDSSSSRLTDGRQPASLGDNSESYVQAPGRRTAIEKARLHVFNFQVVDLARSDVDVSALKPAERSQFISSVLRFCPVEVAMRYYDKPLIAADGASAFASPTHEVASLGDQGYEHTFNVRLPRSAHHARARAGSRHTAAFVANVAATSLSCPRRSLAAPARSASLTRRALARSRSRSQAAVLFSDISGFTKLTNRLLRDYPLEGAEILNKIINSYFEELIGIITRHSGDVIKFAGDAVLSIWSSNVSGESLEQLTNRACTCAIEQLHRMHNWDTGRGEVLQLHLGLGAGRVRGVDLGNFLRREYVVAGEPLKQLSDAEQQAESGQLVVSPQAWKLVETVCDGYELPADPAFGPGFHVVTKSRKPPPLPAHWRVVLEAQMKTASVVPAEALRNMWVYAPGPMRPHLISGKLGAASQFREVTMMFCRIGGLHYSDANFVEKFQRVVYMICSAVYVYRGSLSRVSIDDKGTCVKVTFGLPPLYHNDDPARAVRCGLLIRDQIRPMRLKANVGITTGKVFVGYVGSSSRGEYTEYGVWVNLAARFMSQATNEVLVNSTTYDKALQTDKIDFDQLPAVKMKGFDDPVPKFRAVAVIDAAYYELEYSRDKLHGAHGAGTLLTEAGAQAAPMVGRRELLSACEASLSQYALTGEGVAMIVKGESGVGKTKLVEEIINVIAPLLGVLPLQAAASSTESSDHLYVWRQVFHLLPRLLGHGETVEAGRQGFRAQRNGTATFEQLEAVKTMRSIYRKWLYTPPQARARPEKPRSSFSAPNAKRTSITDGFGERRVSRLSAARGSMRRGAGGAHSGEMLSLRASHGGSTRADRSAAAAALIGAHPADLFTNLSEMIVGAPAPADARGRAGSPVPEAGGFEQEAARFRLHESLLNDVLDCGFSVSDSTLELSEEVRVELTMNMLAHLLDSALYELESSQSKRALIVIEDAQWMDSASWTMLSRVAELVPSVLTLITMQTSGSGGHLARNGGDLASTATSTSAGASYSIPLNELPTEASKYFKLGRIQLHSVLPLERQDVHDLLCVRFGVQMVQPEVVDAVYQRTAGNALYCIELATTMLDREVLRLSNDVCKLAIAPEDLATIELPNSLQAAMSMQLDRLTAPCAACIKAASVMGMQFPAVVLVALGLDGVGTPTEREEMLSMLVNAKMVEKLAAPSPWAQFLDGGSGGEQLSGGVYRFSSWLLREVAYNSLPFEDRRHKHLAIARWIEGTIDKVLGDTRPDTHLRLWLYPMLGEHWLQMTGSESALNAVGYFERAAKAALEASMNHEAIVFIKKELKLLRERAGGGGSGSDKTKTATQRALAQTMLADAYLAVGTIPEAKEVILDALDVLDRPVETSREVLRKRFRAELKWLRRPLLLMDMRSLYPRKHLSEQEALTVARLYEHLGRAAYLLEEMEMHDMAVLRCLNLSLLTRRKAAAGSLTASLTGTWTAERWRPEPFPHDAQIPGHSALSAHR